MTAESPFHPYKDPKLTIELVPFGQWFDNVRARLSPAKWNQLKHACFVQAGHRCTICHGVGKKHPVECHEIWHYDDESKVQTLKGLISLCPSCHRVKHIGNAQRMGFLPQTLRHMAKVNEWPIYMAEAYFEVSMENWQYRSNFAWTLNLDWLDKAPEYIAIAAEYEKVTTREARKTRASDVLSDLTRKRSSEDKKSLPSAPRDVPGVGIFS